MMVHQETPVIEFTAADRCDRCPGRAYTLARKDGLELLFCPHHSKAFRQTMFDNGWEIVDDAAGLEELGYKIPELV